MVHYILHVGYGKTGTTALQGFLAANRDQLRARGVIYPDALVRGAWLRAKDHNMVGRAVVGRLGWWKVPAEDYFAQFEEQRKSANAETVILSGESFMGILQPWDFKDDVAYWQALTDAVQSIGALLKPHQVTVVVYLRRQDHWIDSAINQTIKFGGLLADDTAQQSTERLVEMYSPRLDYARCIEAWANVFGDDAIKVGIYEAGQLHDGGIVDDFFERIGLDMDGLTVPAQSPDGQNTSLTRDVLEVKRILNKIERPKYVERVLVECLRTVSAQMGGADEDAWPMLNNAARRALIDQFESSNAEVARRFCGRSNGVLFKKSKLSAKAAAGEYPGLSVEKALEIMMRVERYMTSFATRRQLARQWLAQQLRQRMPVVHGFARSLQALLVKRV